VVIKFTGCEYNNKCPENSDCIEPDYPLIGEKACICHPGWNGTSCDKCMYFYLNIYRENSFTHNID